MFTEDGFAHLQTVVIHGKAFDHVFLQNRRCPFAEMSGSNGIHAIAYRNNGIKITYIEELGTLYLLQYCLASQKEEATAWYFFFNEFSMSEFSREDFVAALQKYIKMEDTETDYAIRSLNDDFQCIINTHLPRYKSSPDRVNPKNNIDSPFGEFGLVDILNKRKKTYKKSIPASDTLSPYVVMAVIVKNADGRNEITLPAEYAPHHEVIVLQQGCD